MKKTIRKSKQEMEDVPTIWKTSRRLRDSRTFERNL
jgi:hypothetical protein